MAPLLHANLSPGCVTGVGSLPFLDADEAVEFVAEHCPELPFWPQLPRREPGEGVIGQGMGTLIEYLEPASRPYCWATRAGAGPSFKAALEGRAAGLSPETAAGFFALEKAIASGQFPAAKAVKAQMEGPATCATACTWTGSRSRGFPARSNDSLPFSSVKRPGRWTGWRNLGFPCSSCWTSRCYRAPVA